MTYTAEQLRRVAVAIERMHGETLTVEWRDHQAGLLRAFADALEENERLKERVALDDTEREYRRQSLANEIRETLKVRGHFAAERPSDLIGCVARAIESERDRASLAEAELAKLRQMVAQQANAATAPEAYLQQELRKLHAAVEETK